MVKLIIYKKTFSLKWPAPPYFIRRSTLHCFIKHCCCYYRFNDTFNSSNLLVRTRSSSGMRGIKKYYSLYHHHTRCWSQHHQITFSLIRPSTSWRQRKIRGIKKCTQSSCSSTSSLLFLFSSSDVFFVTPNSAEPKEKAVNARGGEAEAGSNWIFKGEGGGGATIAGRGVADVGDKMVLDAHQGVARSFCNDPSRYTLKIKA